MTKTKISLANKKNSMNSSGISKSNILKNSIIYNSTLPNLRNKNFNELFYESFVEKYNEKINLWQNYYLCVKKNYLYLYDKKPRIAEKPKEYLYLNNKISVTFHRRLFKLKTLKNYVVNIKINNEALVKSSIEDNKHNLYISFKTQSNYNNFKRIFDNVLNYKEYMNSVSSNQIENKKIKKHLKNKSESHIQLNNNLINKNKNEEINNKSYESKINMNSINKSNNSFTKSINNVFTFSKIDGTNDKKLLNSNSSKRSNSCNTNNRKNLNNLVIEEENDIMSLKADNNINNNISTNNSKRSINYFNVNFNENNLKLQYKDYDSNINNNNIFDTDFSPSLIMNTSNLIERPNSSLIYSIKRKKEKEKEDENKINNKMKKMRRNSCYGFTFNNNKYNNIFLRKNGKKEENKIKTIKIKLKNYHSFCDMRPSFHNNMNISDYSRDDMSILMNNTGTHELTNYSFNEIEEKNSECKSSKSKEKENDKTKNNTNTDISLGSLKSFKSDSKEKEIKQNEKFEGINLYSYIYNSNISKNNNIENNNPISFLENNDNISNIRNQISQIIKQNEEIIIKNQLNNEEKDNESDTNIIFTSRLRDEITENNSNDKSNFENMQDKKEEENNKDIDNIKNELTSNEEVSNIMNTSNNNIKNHLRFSSDLNDLIQNLENENKKKNNEIIYENKISIPFNIFFKMSLDFDFINFDVDSIINDKNMMKILISKIDNNEMYIYDSYICDLLLSKIKETLKCFNSLVEQKGNITKNKILGKMYNLSNNKYVKYFLLCEMIAIISKKEMTNIMVNAFEIHNKKKEIKKNEMNMNYDEYIFDIFNKYLSRNKLNNEYKDLYEEILPKQLKELFQIKESEGNLINIIKNEIHPNTLFNSMQYHNKLNIYNINIENENVPNFDSLKPLNNNYKYYISPYLLEKWKSKALKDNVALNKEENFNDNVKKNEKEKEAYNKIKQYEKLEEEQRLNLLKIIVLNINQDEINMALKNCEYFLEKYKGKIIFLHPLVYLCLSFLYIKMNNYELSEKYYKMSSKYLNWLFPNKNNCLFFELEYKHLLILLNNEKDNIMKNEENIINIIEQCEKMWKKYNNGSENIELKLDEIIFRIYFRINDEEKNDENYLCNIYYNNIKPLLNEFEGKLKKRKYMANNYIKIFIEFFKKCPGSNLNIFDDLIKFYNSFK